MAEITKATGLYLYVDETTGKFKNVAKDAELQFEFAYKQEGSTIDYIEGGCGCTKAWYDEEAKNIKATLSIAKSGTFQAGENGVNKYVTVMLNPGVPYLIGGPKKERIVNEEKPFFRLTLAGTVYVDAPSVDV